MHDLSVPDQETISKYSEAVIRDMSKRYTKGRDTALTSKDCVYLERT